MALLPISLVFVAGQSVYLFKHGTMKDKNNPQKSDQSNQREM